jgi:lambda repressor-like predicted transcriptional regulator
MKTPSQETLRAVELYNSGQSIQQVADIFVVTRQAMWDRLVRGGAKMRPQRRYGKDNHFYKGGGRKLNGQGYVKLYVNGQWLFEHRVLMAKAIGRALQRHEDVHHINGIRDDNRLENLEVKTRSQHLSDHKMGRAVPESARARQREKLLGQHMHRPDILVASVVFLRSKGLSFLQISKELGCSWPTVKLRWQEACREQPRLVALSRNRTPGSCL